MTRIDMTPGTAPEGAITEALPPVIRPDGRVYQPRKIAAYAVADADEDLSGVTVLGTHDMAIAQKMASGYAEWQLGRGSAALDPEVGWFREGYENGRPMWQRDPVKGRAGVMFHGLREGPDPLEHPLCPGGCGCRPGTDDADARECGCDGGCCGD